MIDYLPLTEFGQAVNKFDMIPKVIKKYSQDLYYDLNDNKINNDHIYRIYKKLSKFREEHKALMLDYFILDPNMEIPSYVEHCLF
jgi:hypothetical protein